MTDEFDIGLTNAEVPDIVRKIRTRTPARLLVGRAGAAYRTATQMDLREAHAAARDAVRAHLDLKNAFGDDFLKRWNLFEVRTKAKDKDEYLLRPDLGRQFDEESRLAIQEHGSKSSDIQIAVGDGLSVPAVTSQVPALLPLLLEGAKERGWTVGRTFVIQHCRVGILNEIGELLNPRVAVLLIGERPGLATSESLSAYMAYQPCISQTDADRNLLSNIHARGVKPQEAADRILRLSARMMKSGKSGYLLKEGSLELEDQ